MFLAYRSPTGRALIDRRLNLPEATWCQRPDRLAAAGVPDQVGFATKPALAQQMIAAALDDAFPADRFHRPIPGRSEQAAEGLPLRLPSGLLPAAPPAPRTPPAVEVDAGSVTVSTARPQPVQLVRVVPPSGNLTVAQQQVWLGPALAGTPVTIWVDTDRLPTAPASSPARPGCPNAT